MGIKKSKKISPLTEEEKIKKSLEEIKAKTGSKRGFKLEETSESPFKAKEAIVGTFPDDVNPKDPKQVMDFILGLLKQKGVDVSNAKIAAFKPTPDGSGGVIDLVTGSDQDLFNLLKPRTDEELDDIIKKAKSILKADEPAKPIAIPQDPLKAQFITAFNELHAKCHAMIKDMGEIFDALDAMRMIARRPNAQKGELKAYNFFAVDVLQAIIKACEVGDQVCHIAAQLDERGVPLADVKLETVN